MVGQSIKAKCKNCMKEVPVEQFKLHYKLKMMVCQMCFSGKTDELQKKERMNKQNIPKPLGWDIEDDYLEKYHRAKSKEEMTKFRKIPGSSQVLCICKGCKYEFKYDPFRKRPRTCPYCNYEIPKLNTFSML